VLGKSAIDSWFREGDAVGKTIQTGWKNAIEVGGELYCPEKGKAFWPGPTIKIIRLIIPLSKFFEKNY